MQFNTCYSVQSEDGLGMYRVQTTELVHTGIDIKYGIVKSAGGTGILLRSHFSGPG